MQKKDRKTITDDVEGGGGMKMVVLNRVKCNVMFRSWTFARQNIVNE